MYQILFKKSLENLQTTLKTKDKKKKDKTLKEILATDTTATVNTAKPLAG